MTITLRSWLAWACERAGCKPKERDTLLLHFIDGYTYHSIGEELRVRYETAQTYYYRGRDKLCAQEWTAWELTQFEAIIRASQEPDSVKARALLLAEMMRNSQDPTPPRVDYDTNGRPAAGHDPPVSLEQMMVIVASTPSKPVLTRNSTWQTAGSIR